MNKTLSLNRRAHLFVKNNELFIKLQQQNRRNADKPDFFILKRFDIAELKKIRDWADDNIKESEAAHGKAD